MELIQTAAAISGLSCLMMALFSIKQMLKPYRPCC